MTAPNPPRRRSVAPAPSGADGATGMAGATGVAGATGTGPRGAARGAGGATVDVHQHLWPPRLVDALRARREPPYLDEWILHLPGEPPYAVDPADHDPVRRAAREPRGRRVLLSLSSPLGIEDLPTDEAEPLLAAWHEGALALGDPFGVWAALGRRALDLAALEAAFAAGCVGLQLPATWLATPQAVRELAPVLAACEALGRPVLIHPGPVATPPATSTTTTLPVTAAEDKPAWWAAGVDYVAQQHAAYWAWHLVGREVAPRLRVCFVALAGLAPAHHERLAARGRAFGRLDPQVWFDTSSYGPQGIDAMVRAVGIDGIVLGSDRPYGVPADLTAIHQGDAAAHAISISNPHRLLHGGPV